MKNISELPEPYKSLAEERKANCNTFLICKDDSGEMTKSFSWYMSVEGFDFWEQVYFAKTESELPPIPEEG